MREIEAEILRIEKKAESLGSGIKDLLIDVDEVIAEDKKKGGEVRRSTINFWLERQ